MRQELCFCCCCVPSGPPGHCAHRPISNSFLASLFLNVARNCKKCMYAKGHADIRAQHSIERGYIQNLCRGVFFCQNLKERHGVKALSQSRLMWNTFPESFCHSWLVRYDYVESDREVWEELMTERVQGYVEGGKNRTRLDWVTLHYIAFYCIALNSGCVALGQHREEEQRNSNTMTHSEELKFWRLVFPLMKALTWALSSGPQKVSY